MLITIVTIYRCETANTYVSVCAGELSEAERRNIINLADLQGDNGDVDAIGFVVKDTDETTMTLHNAFPY